MHVLMFYSPLGNKKPKFQESHLHAFIYLFLFLLLFFGNETYTYGTQ